MPYAPRGYSPAMPHPAPGGTPETQSGSLPRSPTTPEQSAAGEVEPPVAAPGTYQADEAERERGEQVEPGG